MKKYDPTPLVIWLFLSLSCSCNQPSDFTPCSSSADLGNKRLNEASIDQIPFSGSEQLIYRNMETGAQIEFFPRQEEIKIHQADQPIVFPFTCGGERAEMSYTGEEVRLSYISNEGHVLNYLLFISAVAVEPDVTPSLLDLMSIELHQPTYDAEGHLSQVNSCVTYFPGLNNDGSFPDMDIIEAQPLVEPFETIYDFDLNGVLHDSVWVKKCDDFEEVVFLPNFQILSFQDQNGMRWVYEGTAKVSLEIASNIVLPDLEGNQKRLYDIDQSLTIILFWASWSKPSLELIQDQLDAIYNAYGQEGLEIFAVSIDDDRAAWAKAVEENDLPWINVVDLAGNNASVLSDYEVETLPTTLVLNEDKEVLARNLKPEALVAFVDQFFD